MSNPDDALRHKLADFVTEEDSGEGNIVEDIIALIKQNITNEGVESIGSVLENLFGEVDLTDLTHWITTVYAPSINGNPAESGETAENQTSAPGNEEKTNKDVEEVKPPAKKSRPAIYDEAEREEKIQEVRKKHNEAQKNKKQQQNQNQNQQKNQQNRKPAKSPPKKDNEDSGKKSIFDRLKKPATSLRDKVELVKRNSTQSLEDKLNKKVKPNEKYSLLDFLKERQNDGDNNQQQKVKPPPKTKYMVQAEQAQKYQPSQTSSNQKPKQPPKPKPEVEENKDDQGGDEDQNNDAEGLKKYKIRCRNWPACDKKDNCLYVHPSEQCKFFPACTAGDKCLYLHPAINCKFGIMCQRPGCNYMHPSMGAIAAQGMYRPQKKHFNGYGAQGQGEQ